MLVRRVSTYLAGAAFALESLCSSLLLLLLLLLLELGMWGVVAGSGFVFGCSVGCGFGLLRHFLL